MTVNAHMQKIGGLQQMVLADVFISSLFPVTVSSLFFFFFLIISPLYATFTVIYQVKRSFFFEKQSPDASLLTNCLSLHRYSF